MTVEPPHPERGTFAFKAFEVVMRAFEYTVAAVFLVVGVYATLLFLRDFAGGIAAGTHADAYVLHETLRELVSNFFLAFVFLELAALFIHQRLSHLLNVVILVLSRKILLAADAELPVILDIVALGLVFAIRKFLMPKRRVRAPFGPASDPNVLEETDDSMRAIDL